VKKRFSPFRLLINMLIGSLIAVTLTAFGIPFGVTFTGFALFNIAQIAAPNLFTLPNGASLMAVQTEVWIRDIEEELYGTDTWIYRATNDSQYVNNKTVHVPRSGANPTIVKNRSYSGTPATVGVRADTTQDYNIDEYTTDPVTIPSIEEIQTSYSKRQSVLRQHMDSVNDRIALETADAWISGITATDIFRTTGASGALLPGGATAGSRLKVTAADISLIAARMDEEEVPQANRVCVMPAVMFADLFSDTTLANIWANSNKGSNIIAEPQLMGRFMGFDIYVRGRVIVFNTISGTAKIAVTAAVATATAGAAGALFFQSGQVRYAKGAIMPYLQENAPQFHGDVMSIGVLHGAKATRSTEIGIKVLAQGGSAT
jgi:hypothetical protein